MKAKTLLLWLTGLAIGSGLVVCSRPSDDVTAVTDYRLVKTTRYNASGRTVEIDTTLFSYDADGRLAGYASHSIDPKAIRQTSLTYNGLGRVTHIDEQLPNGGFTNGQQKIVGYRAVYNYDAQGRVEQVTVSAALDNFTSFIRQDDYQFTYGADNTPAKLNHIKLNSNYYDSYEYTYEKGNAVGVRYSSTVLTKAVEYKYEYDDKRNAYRDIVRLVPVIDQYNKNNLITGLSPTYDERGLLVKTTTPGQNTNNVTTYAYEAYTKQ